MIAAETASSEADGPIDVDLAQTLTHRVARAAHVLEQHVSRALAPTGLTYRQFRALVHVGAEPGISNSDLASRLLVSRQAANTLVCRLVSAHFLDRAPGRPRQRLILYLSPSGRKALAQAQPLVVAAEASLLSTGAGEPDAVRDVLREVLNSLCESRYRVRRPV